MAEWTKQYPVSFTPTGDTTSQALEKHINELARIYELLNRVRKFDAGTTAPTDPIEGHFWLDTSSSPWRLKVYDGTDWVDILVGNADTVDEKHASDLANVDLSNVDNEVIIDKIKDDFLPLDTDTKIEAEISENKWLTVFTSGILSFHKQSACAVYLSNAQTIQKNEVEKIELDEVIFDIQDEFDDSNHRITVTEDGIYIVIGQVEFDVASSGDYLRAYIYVNGDAKALSRLTPSTTYWHTLNVIKIFELEEGDYIDLRAKNADHEDIIIAGTVATYLCVAKIA